MYFRDNRDSIIVANTVRRYELYIRSQVAVGRGRWPVKRGAQRGYCITSVLLHPLAIRPSANHRYFTVLCYAAERDMFSAISSSSTFSAIRFNSATW